METTTYLTLVPRHSRRLAAALCLFCIGVASASGSTGHSQSYRDLPLEELLQLEVYQPGSLSRLTRLESPTAITTISAEDLRLTPARNLYDLIEIYVPGAIWMNQETGPLLGVRGVIAARNYKYLLLVNGRVLNNKSFAGASSELEMWDLSDIERIDIVRGPGAVTYGPGAVGGVISITTRRPGQFDGTTVRAGVVSEYDSRSLAISHGGSWGGVDLFAHASLVDTEGQTARSFQVEEDNSVGYVGADLRPDSEALDYFGDYNGDPQVKLHLDLALAEGWRWWSRYTQQGSHWFSDETKTEFDGRLVNQEGSRSRQIATSLEHERVLSDTASLQARISFDSYDYLRRKSRAFVPERDSPLNYQVRFAEHEVLTHALLRWQASPGLHLALGAEWGYDRYGPGWDDGRREMRHGDSGEIINGPDSLALHPIGPDDPNYVNRNSADRLAPRWPALYVGSGWSTTTTSLFFESELSASVRHKLLLSGRADHSTYSDTILSPRAAWIWSLRDGHVLRLTAQRASRMNTSSQMLANDRNGLDNTPEDLETLELRYSSQPSTRLGLDLSLFHNRGDVIAYQSADNTHRRVGRLRINGLEAELRYEWERGRIGASFSWVEQQDWELDAQLTSSSVSYADYRLPIRGTGGAVQRGQGNALNNWRDRSLKAFANLRLDDRLTLHVDARWLGAMNGARDGLTGLRDAVEGTPAATDEFFAALDRVAQEDVYDGEFHINALLEYAFSPRSSVQLFAHNLFESTGNKRYGFDRAGAREPAPERVRFLVEPQSIGLRLSHRF
jgi:outer membrane receptor protein involved in Fe transport